MSRSLTASVRKNLVRLASELPQGSSERRAILAGLQKVSAEPVMQIHGRRVRVNAAFAQKIKRLYSDTVLEGTPRGGFTLIYPQSDGSSNYDFYFSPARDITGWSAEKGWYDVSYTPGYLRLLQKDADKIRATTTRMARSERGASEDPYSAEALRKKHRGFPVTVDEFKRKFPKLTVEMYDDKVSNPTPDHDAYQGTFYLWDLIRHNIEAAGMSTDENHEDFASVFFFAEHPVLSSLVKARVGQTVPVFEGSGGWWSYRRAKDGTGKRIR